MDLRHARDRAEGLRCDVAGARRRPRCPEAPACSTVQASNARFEVEVVPDEILLPIAERHEAYDSADRPRPDPRRQDHGPVTELARRHVGPGTPERPCDDLAQKRAVAAEFPCDGLVL